MSCSIDPSGETCVKPPSEIAQLGAAGRDLIAAWIDLAGDLLTEPLLAVTWLVNPAVILVGRRLPCAWVERLTERLTENLRQRSPAAPAPAPVGSAAMVEDAPAIGAALLPFPADLLPSRCSLMMA